VIVARRGTEERVVMSGSWGGSGGETVEHVGGGVETLRLEASRKRSLEQKGAHDIGSGANHALSLAILSGGVGRGHTQLDTAREEERAGGMIIELTPVVTLDGLNGEAELSGHPGEEVGERGERLRLGAQRKGLRIVREVIEDYQVVLVPRDAGDRRSPQVTVDEIKDVSHVGGGSGERETNVATQLARVAETLIRRLRESDIYTMAKLSQCVAAGVTKTTVPSGGRRGGGEGSGRGERRRSGNRCRGRRKPKSVQGPRAVTTEKGSSGS